MRRRSLTDAAVLAALVVLCVGFFALDTLLMSVMTDRLHMNDFGKFYYSTRAFIDGGDMYAPNAATALPVKEAPDLQLLNMNPPHFHLLILPFARLSPERAVMAWMIISLAALILSTLLIVREVGFAWSPRRILLALFGILAFAGTQAFFVTGQLSMLLLLAVTCCWISARRGRWQIACMCLGACLSIKPFFLIFVPYLLGIRKFRPLTMALGTAVACFALGVMVFGLGAYQSWYRALSQSNDWAWTSLNASALGLFRRSFDIAPGVMPVVVQPQLVKLWLVVAGLVGVVTVAAVHADRTNTDRAFALLLVGSQIVSPLGWIYYLSIAAGPIAGVLMTTQDAERRPHLLSSSLGAIAIVGFLWPNPLLLAFQPNRWATVFVASIYFWATLAAWMWLLIERRR